MISTIAVVMAVFFFVGVLIDLKTKKVPSVLFTSLIFVSLFIAGFSYGYEIGFMHILFGIIMAVFGILLWEMYFIGGLADIKALILMGILCTDFASLILMIFLTVTLGTLYQALFKAYNCYKGQYEGNIWKAMFLSKNEEPFLLLLFFVYVIMIFIGGII